MMYSVPLWITRQRRKLKNIKADVLNIPEVETCLLEILEDKVSDLDEVSVNDSNGPLGRRTQDPYCGTVNDYDRQSQELVAVISDK